MAAYNPYNLSNSSNNLFSGSGLAASMGGKSGDVDSWGGVADWSQPFSGGSNAATAITAAADAAANVTAPATTTLTPTTTAPANQSVYVDPNFPNWKPGDPSPYTSNTPEDRSAFWLNFSQNNPQSFAATLQGLGPRAVPYDQLSFEQRGDPTLTTRPQTPEQQNQLSDMSAALTAYITKYGYNPMELDETGASYKGGNSALW